MKFHAVPETEVFVNIFRHLVISQVHKDGTCQAVVLPKAMAVAVAQHILAIAEDLTDAEE